MTKKVSSVVAAFASHLDGELREPQVDGGDWVGDCLFCGKDKHFYVDEDTGKWDCKVCGESGNLITFLTKVTEHWYKRTSKESWRRLSQDRKIPSGLLKRRKLAFNGSYWLVPCRSHTGYIHDIRRYDWKRLMSTAGCKSQLFGMELLAKAKPGTRVWLCEGEWDAMAMDWLLRELENDQDVVVGVPGASTLKPEWHDHFAGKHVIAVYDADDAGEKGAAKAYAALRNRSKKLEFINWPETKKEGYDLRDYVSAALPDSDPAAVMAGLLALRSDHPRGMRNKNDDPSRPPGEAPQVTSDLKPIGFEELVQVFRKHIMMNEDMVEALKVCCAVALSNDLPGDPLWIYLVAPPGTGKTLLLSSFSSSPRCLFRSTVTPHSLVSGWRGEGANDPSLIPKLKGLTLVAKDFTEILTLPPLEQDKIFSTLRGAYDGSVQKDFGNGVNRSYDGCYFSMLAGVTHKIHANKNASLGERFLKFQFKGITREHTDDVIMAAINNVGRERQIEDDLKLAVEAFLNNKMDAENPPLIAPGFSARLLALTQLISLLRAQVDRDWRTSEIAFRPTPEMGTRLAKQLVRLGMAVARVQGKEEIDAEVYATMERTAFDTAYGFHFDIVDAIMSSGNRATKLEVSVKIGLPLSSVGRRFEDLEMVGVIKRETSSAKKPGAHGRAAAVFSVTDIISSLWLRAKGAACEKKSASRRPVRPSRISTTGSGPRRRPVSAPRKRMIG